MTTIQPTGDHIIIEAVAPPEQKPGDLIIPDKFKQNEHECRVIAVGPGRWGFKDARLPMEVKVGDIILAHRNNGTEIVMDGKQYRVIQSDSVMAILKFGPKGVTAIHA
jgi:chaperonin GroES